VYKFILYYERSLIQFLLLYIIIEKFIQIDYKYTSSCLQKEKITMAFYQDFENKSESLTSDQTSRILTFLTLLFDDLVKELIRGGVRQTSQLVPHLLALNNRKPYMELDAFYGRLGEWICTLHKGICMKNKYLCKMNFFYNAQRNIKRWPLTSVVW